MPRSITYELAELEKMFAIGELRVDNPSASEETIRREVQRVKESLVHEVFTFQDERHLERYIQYHQQSLIRLMDKAAYLIRSSDKTQDDLWQTLYSGFDELLLFIERHFTKYFDLDSKAPDGYIAIARREAADRKVWLEKLLSEKRVDPGLSLLLVEAINRIAVANSDLRITYRMVLYSKELYKECQRVLEGDPFGEVNERLREVMYYLNYNSAKAFAYHVHYLNGLVEASNTRKEKIERLSFVLKCVNQSQVKPGMRYYEEGPSLKEQLSQYISEEVGFHERMLALNNDSPKGSHDSFFSGFKLKYDISVSQLAYLLRILLEMKIILNDNLTHVFHFIVKYGITKRSEVISYGSFRSKYYCAEYATRQTVKKMLQAMIRYIDGMEVSVVGPKLEMPGPKQKVSRLPEDN